MNSKKNWLVAAGLVAAVTASGMAMAPVNAEKQEAPQVKTGVGHGQFKGDRQAFKAEVDKLLAFLKIDEATFKAEMKDGKTLASIAKERGISEQDLKAFLVEQITGRIDEGVAAGRIPADQAAKMKADMDKHVTAMINGKGPFGHGPMAGHAPFANEKLLALLKIDADTLKSEMKDGKTLAAIAKEHGVSEKKLKDFMVSEITQRIDEGVQTGRIPADRAEKMKADMDKRVTDMINGKGPMVVHKTHAFFADGKLAAFLKTDADTLKSEMKAGKTLAAIAKEHGVSEKKLKDFMVSEMTQRIDEGVQAGRIPADRAEKMKADMDKRVTDMINGKGPMVVHKTHAFFADGKLAAFLKTDADTLKSEMKNGKTLAAIAKEQGVSEQALKTFLVEQMTQRIDEGVQAGRIPTDRAEKMKAGLDQHVTDMINGEGPMHRHETRDNS